MQLKLEYTRVERVLLRAPQVFGDKQIYLKLYVQKARPFLCNAKKKLICRAQRIFYRPSVSSYSAYKAIRLE